MLVMAYSIPNLRYINAKHKIYSGNIVYLINNFVCFINIVYRINNLNICLGTFISMMESIYVQSDVNRIYLS